MNIAMKTKLASIKGLILMELLTKIILELSWKNCRNSKH